MFPAHRCSDDLHQLFIRRLPVCAASSHDVPERYFGIAEEADLFGRRCCEHANDVGKSRKVSGLTFRLPSAVILNLLHVPQK